MGVVREPVPYNAGVPATEVFDLVRVYSKRPGFPGDGGMEFMVAKGFEGAL